MPLESGESGRKHEVEKWILIKNNCTMDKMDLKKYGITGVTEIVYNPSYDELFR